MKKFVSFFPFGKDSLDDGCHVPWNSNFKEVECIEDDDTKGAWGIFAARSPRMRGLALNIFGRKWDFDPLVVDDVENALGVFPSARFSNCVATKTGAEADAATELVADSSRRVFKVVYVEARPESARDSLLGLSKFGARSLRGT